MSKAVTPPRWYAAWRAVVPAAQDDPADLGTAYGLDLSLSELMAEPRPPIAVERRTGWVRRLAPRRKPAV
jgi:hypothetical protein